MDYAEEDASELVLRHAFDAFDRLGDKLWSEELVKDLISKSTTTGKGARHVTPLVSACLGWAPWSSSADAFELVG